MTLVLLGVRLLLALVFVIAGAAKLRTRSAFMQALTDFGVPQALVPGAALAIPLLELSTAALLIPSASARLGAVTSLVLLSVFTIAVASNLARGKKPDCGCFGSATSEPIGGITLLRNGILLALTTLLLIAGTDSDAFAIVPVWQATPVEGRILGAYVLVLLVVIGTLTH